MITARQSERRMSKSVFTDKAGRFSVSGLSPGIYMLRARRIGFDDQMLSSLELAKSLTKHFLLSPSENPSAQLPASTWFAQLPFASTSAREQFKLDCLVCHQIGSEQTRRARNLEEWADVIKWMRSLYAQAAEGPAATQTDRERIKALFSIPVSPSDTCGPRVRRS
jgi:hypothetical protein